MTRLRRESGKRRFVRLRPIEGDRIFVDARGVGCRMREDLTQIRNGGNTLYLVLLLLVLLLLLLLLLVVVVRKQTERRAPRRNRIQREVGLIVVDSASGRSGKKQLQVADVFYCQSIGKE